MVSPVPGNHFYRNCKLWSSCGQMWEQQRQGWQWGPYGCGCTQPQCRRVLPPSFCSWTREWRPITRRKRDKTSSLFDKSLTLPAGLSSCDVLPTRTPQKQPGTITSIGFGCHTWPSSKQKVSPINILQAIKVVTNYLQMALQDLPMSLETEASVQCEHTKAQGSKSLGAALKDCEFQL